MAGKKRQQTQDGSAAAQQETLAATGAPAPAAGPRNAQQGRSTQQGQPARDAQLVGLHRSKCWDWTPSAVVAMAACPQLPVLAVGLESGDIQLWDTAYCTHIQTVVGFSVEVTALTWVRDPLSGAWRTIAAALDGSIAEVSWQQGRLVGLTDSGAGAVWGLAAQPADTVPRGFAHPVAAGCDDGSVRVFTLESGEPGVSYDRTLTTFQGRVLTLAWHPSGKSLVVGGADGCIHALDPTTGQESLRITAGASTSQPVCVWRLLVLRDGTVVSGDSGGALQFWDSQFGTLLQRFDSFKADVLALAAAPSGAYVWASGADSKVAMFERVTSAHSSGRQERVQWVANAHKRPHTHDVRALEVSLGQDGISWLVSGGLDAQLLMYPASSSFLSVHPARFTKAPQAPLCKLSSPAQAAQQHSKKGDPAQQGSQAAGRFLCAQGETVDIWQVGCTGWATGAQRQGSSKPGQRVDLTIAPRHVTRVRTSGAGRVSTADLSSSGRMVAVAAGPSNTLRVYQLQEQQGAGQLQSSVHVQRVLAAAPVSGVTAVCVSDQVVVTAHPSGKLRLHQLQPLEGSNAGSGQPVQLQQVAECSLQSTEEDRPGSRGSHSQSQKQQASWEQFVPTVSKLCMSPNGSMVAAVCGRGIALLRVADGGGKATITLQQTGPAMRLPHDALVTSLSFSPDAATLAVTLASEHVLMISTAARRPTEWSLQNSEAVAGCVARLPGVPTGVSFSASGKHLLVYSSGGFCALDLTRPVDDPAAVKRQRTAAKPKQGGPDRVGGAGPVVDHMARGRPQAPQQAGCNGWVTTVDDPVALVGFVSAKEVLLLEKPWLEVLSTLPPPLHRHRYGS